MPSDRDVSNANDAQRCGTLCVNYPINGLGAIAKERLVMARQYRHTFVDGLFAHDQGRKGEFPHFIGNLNGFLDEILRGKDFANEA